MNHRMLWAIVLLSFLAEAPSAPAADALPFSHKVDVFCGDEKEAGIKVFVLRLEQPFLAEEFEKSNYLRLEPADDRAYLIYPKEAVFQQKHAEFYGRLRGEEGKAKLQLSYEIVSEKPDGSRHVQTRQSEIEVPVPAEPTGQRSLYAEWAKQQNRHFAELLRYYPEETFFQYVLLQSEARYGVTPPQIPKAAPQRSELETDLYQVFTGSLAIQESLQREALSTTGRSGDLNVHISTLSPPLIKSLPYKELLEPKPGRPRVEPKPHEIARLVPEDQYFLHFHSMQSLGELLDLTNDWGDNLLRLATVRAKDQQVESKLEEQLCVRRNLLTRLFADAVISELAVTGADPFVQEGTDVTIIFRVKQPAILRKAAAGWLDEARKKHRDLVEAEFNYRGHKVAARYTSDRVVSSFVVEHQDYMIFSNSHRAVRRLIDVAVGQSPSLFDSLDYRYVTTVLPPSPAANCGYFFASEATIRRLVGPAAKICEKRRLQCFNNLVMLNNASLFYRLEHGKSAENLGDLVEGRFIDPAKIVCAHGGAYTLDAARDTCTCSLHNRLKHLTPNVELTVLNVSQQEAAEYERYKQRYQAFWLGMFDPIAVRVTVGPRIKLETCVLPLANSSLYENLKAVLDKDPRALGASGIAPSAVVSMALVPGRERISKALREVPGVAEALKADPTLTDLSWIGDRISLHFCDDRSILEIDPMQFRPLDAPLIGRTPVSQQAIASALIMALKLPVYLTVDVENRESAARLLDQLSRQIFLKHNDVGGVPITLDGYRLSDYREHALYVFSMKVYAVKLRLHAALVGDQLVVATKPEVLHQVIDAADGKGTSPALAHMLLRLNRRALARMYDDVQLYWEEKARLACHRNISSIYNLHKLYDTPIAEIPQLAEAKYGVRYFCPDGGDYSLDAGRDQISCSVHGNREHSRQLPRADRTPSFSRFIESLDEVLASLRFQDDAMIATLEIARVRPGSPPVAR